jgi:lactoylglutathione lyase
MLSLIVIRARNMDRLAEFYSVLGLHFSRECHGQGPEHLSAVTGETVFEIYPVANPSESTAATRLGFSVPSLAKTIADFRNLNATVLTEPADSPYGRRAVVKDFEGHKVELYEKGA